MEGDYIKVNKWLLPLSWFYGLGVKLRNILFEMGVLKSQAFDLPVISVGNITAGGTGKTPHVEYLVRLLQETCKVAVLSRGYKRKSKGYVLADDTATASRLGDESFQMKQKFPKAIIAVDKKRVHGIKKLQEQFDDIDVVLLDDAFQHRYVKPGINILLVDYHRLIINDRLLPAGRLREPLNGKNRADVVIVTKCPKDLKPMEFRVIKKGMELFAYQTLYFTTFDYDNLQGLFNGKAKPLDAIAPDTNVLLLTGIGLPQQMEADVTKLYPRLTTLHFSDHHNFSQKDIGRINDTFAAMPAPKCIITTEKDAVRLKEAEGLSEEVRQNIYALPIHVTFMLEQEKMFNDYIIGYVRKNSRNSILVKAKDDNKPKDGHRAGNGPRSISFRNN